MGKEIERPYTGAFVGETHFFALRIYIEDTDFGGVVYHANYVRFMERARSDLLRSLGIDQRAAIASGQGMYAVTEMQIQFRRPARLDDELVIATMLEEVRGASCVIHQRILRGQDLVAEASVTVAFLDPSGRPRRQPAEWVGKFERFKAKKETTS